MDDQKFHEFLNRFVGDLGATVAAGGVVLGDQLGLYAALAEGPQTPDVLAASTGTAAAVRRGVAARPGRRRLRRVRRSGRHLLT